MGRCARRTHTRLRLIPLFPLLVVVTCVSHPSVMGVASRAIYEPTVPMFASRAMEGSITTNKEIIMHQIE